MPARLFSDAERAWLALTYPHHRADFTTELFNECWGRDLSKDQIVRAAKRFGLGPSAHDGRFRKGNVPANKGRKGYSPPGSEKGWFRKGGESPNTRPLYSERWDNLSDEKGKTPVLMIKVPGAAPYASQRRAGAHQSTRWVRKAVWVWEHDNGPVPSGHAIVQLDGDPANCQPANLDCVPRATLAMLNCPWSAAPAGPDSNPVRIRVAQVRAEISRTRRTRNDCPAHPGD